MVKKGMLLYIKWFELLEIIAALFNCMNLKNRINETFELYLVFLFLNDLIVKKKRSFFGRLFADKAKYSETRL